MDTSHRHPSPYALVVDDDDLVRMTAADILQEAGFLTFEAADVDAAIAVLDENEALIVLLFTDVHMPGSRDGFALARETARRWPHVSIVVASGRAQPSPEDLPDRARFIGKPFSADVVMDHLKEILPNELWPEPLKC